MPTWIIALLKWGGIALVVSGSCDDDLKGENR